MTDETCCGACGYPVHATKESACDWCRQAADRIEALTEQLAAARQDADEAEAYAEELEADRKKTYEFLLKLSRIHGEVEAKLAKAEAGLLAIAKRDEQMIWGEDYEVEEAFKDMRDIALATLAEIKAP